MPGNDKLITLDNLGTFKNNVEGVIDTKIQLLMATNADITRMFATEYQVSASATHGTISGDSTIWSDESKAFTVTPDVDYALPDSITVIGASYTYDPAAGIIVLSNAVRDVVIEVNCRVATALSNFTYTQDTSAKTLSITGTNPGCPTDLAIAPVYDVSGEEYTVTAIGNNAFKDSFALTSVLLPPSIISIGNYAFENCSRLPAMFIPPNVASIPEYAFHGCSGLRSVNIPDSVTSIGSSAFSGCENLTSIELPSSLTSIESETFYDCSNLASISLPDSLLTIGTRAFKGCSRLVSLNLPKHLENILAHAFNGCHYLSSIYIPSSVSSIGIYAFAECYSVTSIVVSSENVTFDSRDNCNAIIKTSDNELIAGCSTTIIPNTVTSIGIGAFHSCSNLMSIVIPSGITSINYGAFYDCPHLVIYCEAESKPEDWNSYWNPSLRPVVWGYQSAAESNDILYGLGEIAGDRYAIVVGGNSSQIEQAIIAPEINGYPVTKIGDKAFYDCDDLISLTIPSSVISIGHYAFNGCNRLKSVIIPSSVINIGSYAFYNNLNTTVYCEAESKPEGWADYWTSNDNAVFFGYQTTVKSNGINYALCAGSDYRYAIVDSCDESVTQVVISSEINGYPVTKIRNHAFNNYSLQLESVSIPNSVTSIGAWAFSGNDFASIDIPPSVTFIGESAFRNCGSLTSISIPSSVVSIPNDAFYYCDRLRSVTIADGVTSIGSHAFNHCTSLRSIDIPSSMTSIDYSAFYSCSALTSIVIPQSVTFVGSSAFIFCNSLTIYCEANSQPEGWNSYWNPSLRPVVWGYIPQ